MPTKAEQVLLDAGLSVQEVITLSRQGQTEDIAAKIVQADTNRDKAVTESVFTSGARQNANRLAPEQTLLNAGFSEHEVDVLSAQGQTEGVAAKILESSHANRLVQNTGAPEDAFAAFSVNNNPQTTNTRFLDVSTGKFVSSKNSPTVVEIIVDSAGNFQSYVSSDQEVKNAVAAYQETQPIGMNPGTDSVQTINNPTTSSNSGDSFNINSLNTGGVDSINLDGSVGDTKMNDQEKIADLVSRWNAGEFGQDFQRFLSTLATSLGVSEATITDKSGGQSIWEAVTNQFKTDSLPTPRTYGTGGVNSGVNTDFRNREFAEQDDRLVRARGIGQVLGNLSPLSRRAANSAFSRFQDLSGILNFGPKQERGDAFSSFLGGPQETRQSLEAKINNLLDANFASEQGAAQFNQTFGDPEAAASAAIQPFLQSLAPRMRAGVASNLGTQFAQRFAQQPDQFRGEGAAADVFKDFRGRGFLAPR